MARVHVSLASSIRPIGLAVYAARSFGHSYEDWHTLIADVRDVFELGSDFRVRALAGPTGGDISETTVSASLLHRIADGVIRQEFHSVTVSPSQTTGRPGEPYLTLRFEDVWAHSSDVPCPLCLRIVSRVSDGWINQQRRERLFSLVRRFTPAIGGVISSHDATRVASEVSLTNLKGWNAERTPWLVEIERQLSRRFSYGDTLPTLQWASFIPRRMVMSVGESAIAAHAARTDWIDETTLYVQLTDSPWETETPAYAKAYAGVSALLAPYLG